MTWCTHGIVEVNGLPFVISLGPLTILAIVVGKRFKEEVPHIYGPVSNGPNELNGPNDMTKGSPFSEFIRRRVLFKQVS